MYFLEKTRASDGPSACHVTWAYVEPTKKLNSCVFSSLINSPFLLILFFPLFPPLF